MKSPYKFEARRSQLFHLSLGMLNICIYIYVYIYMYTYIYIYNVFRQVRLTGGSSHRKDTTRDQHAILNMYKHNIILW